MHIKKILFPFLIVLSSILHAQHKRDTLRTNWMLDVRGGISRENQSSHFLGTEDYVGKSHDCPFFGLMVYRKINWIIYFGGGIVYRDLMHSAVSKVRNYTATDEFRIIEVPCQIYVRAFRYKRFYFNMHTGVELGINTTS